jgi:hypothetical protein
MCNDTSFRPTVPVIGLLWPRHRSTCQQPFWPLAELQIDVEHGVAFVAAELFEVGRMDAARHPSLAQVEQGGPHLFFAELIRRAA